MRFENGLIRIRMSNGLDALILHRSPTLLTRKQ